MIIKDINNKEIVLYEPENPRERKILESFPGFLREGLHFFSPGKPRIVRNLYQRISKSIKPQDIRYTPYVQEAVAGFTQVKALPADFVFHTKPLSHQKHALEFMYSQGSCGLLLDPGLGKTKVVLDFIFLKKFSKSIIVCPKPLLYVWEAEILRHRPELTFYIIQTTDWSREVVAASKADVVIINYDKAVALEEELTKVNAQFMALDEGLIKNYNTDRTKALTRIGRRIPFKCVMSGTLVNNSPLDCFAPIRFIEPALLGESVTRFKDRYAVVAKQNRNILLGFRDIPEVQTAVASCCIVMRKEEWLKDLPGKKFHSVKSALRGEALECYNSLISNWMFSTQGETFEFDNPLTRMGKLLQIANGFIYASDPVDELDTLAEISGEDMPVSKMKKKRRTLFFDAQPKIQAMHELINDEGRLGNRRAIIWFNYQAELTLIEDYLNEQGIKFLTVKGGDKEIGVKINLFNSDPSYRFLVGQAKTINYGATILGSKESEDFEVTPEFSTTVSDQIFYSLNFSLEVFLQQQDRIHRIGQTKECNYWMLVTNSCIETKIGKAMEDKIRISRALLVDISKEVTLLK